MKIPFLSDFFGVFAELGKAWAEARLEKAKAEVEIQKIRVQASAKIEVEKALSDIKWEQTMAEASKTSWKDEFWTLILAIPVVLVFLPVPAVQEAISNGFWVLENSTPDWYQYVLITAIGASFGVRMTDMLSGLWSRNKKAIIP